MRKFLKSAQQKKREGKNAQKIMLIAIIFKFITSLVVFPPNTQTTAYPELPGLLSRAAITLDRQKFSCRYNPPKEHIILVLQKGQTSVVSFNTNPGLIYQFALTGKDIAMGAFSSREIAKYLYSSTASSLFNAYKSSLVTKKITFLDEINLEAPYLYGSGEGARFYLIDYTRDSGDMVLFMDSFSLNSNLLFPQAVMFRDRRPTMKIINPNKSKYLLRISYLSPGSPSLSVEDNVIMPFMVKKMQIVSETDYLFAKNDQDNDGRKHDVYLINALGPLDGTHIRKKVGLPWFMNEDSFELVQVNHVFGRNKESLLQVWVSTGRVIQLTFPNTGEEPQPYGEVWHKRWKQRFPSGPPGTHFNSRYLPETGDYFSCKGCGENGQAQCLFSWQCHSSCSSCSGPGQTECTSCDTGFDLKDGACLKACAGNQYRKSGSLCFDCPSDHTLIRSNLTCLNCWDHNDFAECEFTRLGYNVSLQESFLNISFTYLIDFYGEERSLEKLGRESNNWPRIFEVFPIKEDSRDPECEKPTYTFENSTKRLRISIKECQREASFYLRALRSKIIIERFKVPLMLNISYSNKFNLKVVKADDEIPIYARFLRYIIWVLFLVFFLYLLLSETKFIENQPLKLIGNFLKMVDFIQCLGLIEVVYKVLISKFFWMIQLVFSSPQFGIFEDFLNDKTDLRRERYLGKIYGEYGDKMALNNYGMLVIVYLGAIIADLVVWVIPFEFVWLSNITGGFREFVYSYGFFEIYINILIDLSNTKKILKNGNFGSRMCLILEAFLVLFELVRTIKKVFGREDADNQGKPKIDRKEKEELVIPLELDTERDGLLDKKNPKTKEASKERRRVRPNLTLKIDRPKNLNSGASRTFPLRGIRHTRSLVLSRINFGRPQKKQKKNSKTNKPKDKDAPPHKNSAISQLFQKFEEVSDMRFILVQTLLASLTNSPRFQISLILLIQVVLMLIAVMRYLLVNNRSESKYIRICSMVQEVSISIFLLLIPVMNLKDENIQYLIVILLSVAIIFEFVIMVEEVVKDALKVFLSFFVSRKRRRRVFSESERATKRGGSNPPKNELNRNNDVNQVQERQNERNKLKIPRRRYKKRKFDRLRKKNKQKKIAVSTKEEKEIMQLDDVRDLVVRHLRSNQVGSRLEKMHERRNFKRKSRLRARVGRRFGVPGVARRMRVKSHKMKIQMNEKKKRAKNDLRPSPVY